MARKGSHQKPHVRKSKYGKKFVAGRGKKKSHRESSYRYESNPNYYATKRILKIVPKKTKHKKSSIVNAPKSVSSNKSENIVPTIARDVLISSMAVAISTATANPLPIIIWKSYKSAKFIEKIYEKINDKKIDGYFQEIPIDIGQSSISDYINLRINQVSRSISASFTESGFSDEISRKTSLSTHTVQNTIENTVNNALTEGWNNLPSLVMAI